MKIAMIQKTNFSKLIILILFVLSALGVSAQRYQNEFSIYCEGGIAAFGIQKLAGKPSSMGFGGDAGIGFTGFFSQNWGIHTGVGCGFFNVTNKVKSFMFVTPELADCEGYLYDLHTTLNNYSENFKTTFLSLPLMVQYQTKMEPISYSNKDKKAGAYALTGAKALLLINNNYTTEITSLYNAAYYQEFDNWINSQLDGLGTFRGNTVHGKLKFNILVMFAFEAGIKWQIGRKLFLYTGAYFDCGLYDHTKKSRVPYNNYTAPEQLDDLILLDFAKKMNLMTGGIKLRLAFSQPQSKNSCR